MSAAPNETTKMGIGGPSEVFRMDQEPTIRYHERGRSLSLVGRPLALLQARRDKPWAFAKDQIVQQTVSAYN